MRTLKHDDEHHMEEESDIFGKARKLFDGQAAVKIGQCFAKRKNAERALVDKKAEQSLEE